MNFLHIKNEKQKSLWKISRFSTIVIVYVEKNWLNKEILIFIRIILILYFACQKFWFCLSNNRGRLCNADIFFTTCVFQSTPSQRGRRLLTVLKTVADTISIHALAKRATCNADIFFTTCVFQSTPSQRGRPWPFTPVIFSKYISIHALAKRATWRNI